MAASGIVVAAKAAAAVLTDKRLRTGALVVIVSVIVALLLPIMVFIAILESPLEALLLMFSEDQHEEVSSLYDEYHPAESDIVEVSPP